MEGHLKRRGGPRGDRGRVGGQGSWDQVNREGRGTTREWSIGEEVYQRLGLHEKEIVANALSHVGVRPDGKTEGKKRPEIWG